MKSKKFQWGPTVCIAVFLLATSAHAQRTPSRKPRSAASPEMASQQSPAAPNPYANIPVIVDTIPADEPAAGIPMRPTSSFAGKTQEKRKIITYEPIRRNDALYAQKVWRELDLREKMNQTFRYDATDDNGSQLFINILLTAVKSGSVAAFADDRFSIPVTPARIIELTQGGLDTVVRYSPTKIDSIEALIVTRKSFDPKIVARLRLMEEWVFDKEVSRMVCRIIGIAALKTEYFQNTAKERGHSVLFWLYYPDLRPVLANYDVYNPKNMGQARMTWEELFESRMFSSYIVKSTLDNAANRTIRQYIKDPILALAEGDNIKDKMFNYEQDLWSY